MKRIRFEVEGRPVPQGSMTASYNTKQRVSHVHHVAGAALAQWRAAIRLAAREADAEILPGPVSIAVVFGMHRAKYPKREYHTVAPDLDKLIRALLDALTGVCYNDDAQVVLLSASKSFAHSTTVVIGPYASVSQKSNKPTAKLADTTQEDTSEGQLHLSDLWGSRSEFS